MKNPLTGRIALMPSRFGAGLVTVVTALAVGGCGSGRDEPKITVSYEKASTGSAIVGRSLMKRTQLLEHVAEEVNHSLVLPYDISLVGAQCGEENAFWNYAEKTITICYEDANLSVRLFKEAGDPDPIAAAFNAEVTTFFHELAHAVIDSHGLPFTGREEDVADQLVVFMLLEPHAGGHSVPDAEQAVRDYARLFELYAARNKGITEDDFADKHTMNQTRVYNLLCWMYGHDPAKHSDLVADGLLPEYRAAGCANEYQELARGWSELLEPHVKPHAEQE